MPSTSASFPVLSMGTVNAWPPIGTKARVPIASSSSSQQLRGLRVPNNNLRVRLFAGLSSTSILGAPLTAYAWNARGAPRGKRLALAALVLALATDIWLVVATVAEGTDYMATALASGPGILWCGLFIGWQLLALLTFLPPTAPISHETLERLRPPDFYLASSESHAFTGPFKCWVQERVAGEIRDDYLLVRIDPPCIDPLTAEPLADILMAGRVAPTFPLSLPANVYLIKILDPDVRLSLRCNSTNSDVVAQGDIFATLAEADKLASDL